MAWVLEGIDANKENDIRSLQRFPRWWLCHVANEPHASNFELGRSVGPSGLFCMCEEISGTLAVIIVDGVLAFRQRGGEVRCESSVGINGQGTSLYLIMGNNTLVIVAFASQLKKHSSRKGFGSSCQKPSSCHDKLSLYDSQFR
jgi:hypothetical protein